MGCASSQPISWCNLAPGKLWTVLPDDPEQCNNQLDSLLVPALRKHFKETDEEVAIVEMYRELGTKFIAGWHLVQDGIPSYKKQKKPINTWSETHGISNNSNISSYFKQRGVNDPSKMIRILFTAYHRKLNNEHYTIDDIIKSLGVYWPDPERSGLFGGLPSGYYTTYRQIEKRDDSIMRGYYFKNIHVGDTLATGFFCNECRFTKKPMLYYLKCAIIQRDSLSQTIRGKLFSIETSKRTHIWYVNKEAKHAGDTIVINPFNWTIRGINDLEFYRNQAGL